MEEKVALIGIIVEDFNMAENVNSILHSYGNIIVGRMGLPFKEKGVNVISIIVSAPSQEINALTGKLGMIKNVTAKALYAKNI